MDPAGPIGAMLRLCAAGDWARFRTPGMPWSLKRFLGRGSSGSELSSEARLEVLRGSAGAGGASLATVGAGDGAGTDPGRNSCFGGDGLCVGLNDE